MATLTTLAPASSYGGILNTLSTTGLTTNLQVIQDGFGNNSTLSLSTTSLDINTSMGNFTINGVPLVSTPSEIDEVCLDFIFSGATNQAVVFPSGTTSQRPSLPNLGSVRYNTTTNKLEAYAGSPPSWQNLTS